MAELLGALGALAILVALFAVVAGVLYFAFGPQAIGLPAMLGALVIVAGATIAGSIQAAVFILLGLAALVAVIGMAMNLAERRPGGGSEPPTAAEARPIQEPLGSRPGPPPGPE
jgi:hypothetical protein